MVAFFVPFLDAAARRVIQPAGEASVDFARPPREAALVSADGEANWLEGAVLTAVYLMLALGFFLLPV